MALLRLDYPIADPDTGMTVLAAGPRFDPETIMPICLPPNSKFKDTSRLGYAAGLGIVGEGGEYSTLRCFTNEKGPVPFQQCSRKYLLENETKILEDDGTFALVEDRLFSLCEREKPPPSSLDPLCFQFYDRINKLRYY